LSCAWNYLLQPNQALRSIQVPTRLFEGWWKDAKEMKNTLILVVLCFSIFGVRSQSLPPLTQWVVDRPNWQGDVSEVVYFSLRCNSVLALVGQYVVSKARNENEVRIGQNIMIDGDAYTLPMIVFGDASGYKYDDVMSRAAKIVKIYSGQMVKNKDITNSIFDGYVGEDFKICTEYSSEFRSISSVLKENLEKIRK
jgi:hypothetical protein